MTVKINKPERFNWYYNIIVTETIENQPLFCWLTVSTTTYLTIDRSEAHGNNGYKTAKDHLLWSRNGYKKPFVAERA